MNMDNEELWYQELLDCLGDRNFTDSMDTASRESYEEMIAAYKSAVQVLRDEYDVENPSPTDVGNTFYIAIVELLSSVSQEEKGTILYGLVMTYMFAIYRAIERGETSEFEGFSEMFNLNNVFKGKR
jgi:hypothetical protein